MEWAKVLGGYSACLAGWVNKMIINKQINAIRKRIIPIPHKNKIKKAGIFESYATGEQKKNSDADILVEIDDRNFSLLDLVKLKITLEKALKRKVGLIEYSALHPIIKENALKEEVRLK